MVGASWISRIKPRIGDVFDGADVGGVSRMQTAAAGMVLGFGGIHWKEGVEGQDWIVGMARATVLFGEPEPRKMAGRPVD